MKKYILISVNERKIFEPDYFETLNDAQAEMIKRVEQIVEESGGKDCVEFEICNLPRLISYDGIGDAVDFSSGSCMLASASGCKTVERGMARMEEDGFWHIIKRSQVLLYK